MAEVGPGRSLCMRGETFLPLRIPCSYAVEVWADSRLRRRHLTSCNDIPHEQTFLCGDKSPQPA
jgi:hypothetical protein